MAQSFGLSLNLTQHFKTVPCLEMDYCIRILEEICPVLTEMNMYCGSHTLMATKSGPSTIHSGVRFFLALSNQRRVSLLQKFNWSGSLFFSLLLLSSLSNLFRQYSPRALFWQDYKNTDGSRSFTPCRVISARSFKL